MLSQWQDSSVSCPACVVLAHGLQRSNEIRLAYYGSVDSEVDVFYAWHRRYSLTDCGVPERYDQRTVSLLMARREWVVPSVLDTSSRFAEFR